MITLAIYFQYLFVLRILRLFVLFLCHCLSQELHCTYFIYKRNNCSLSVSAIFILNIYCLLNICISNQLDLSTPPLAVSEFPENAVCKSLKTVWPCDICFALWRIQYWPVGDKKKKNSLVIIMQLYHSITEGFQFFSCSPETQCSWE